MSLWSYLDKPKYLSVIEKENIKPTNKGWIYTHKDGHEEVLVSIGKLPDKQKPRISDIFAVAYNNIGDLVRVTEYNIEKSLDFMFKIVFSFPILHNLSTESKLLITINNVDYDVDYGWNDELDGSPIFYLYLQLDTINDKNTFLQYDSTIENINIRGLTLNTGEYIKLNHENYINENSIDAILNCPIILNVKLSRPLIPPQITNFQIATPSGLTFNGSYTIEPKIKIVIRFDVDIDATTLTQLSILNFSINNSNIVTNVTAKFSEILNSRQLQFEYDIPVTQLERDAIIPPDTTNLTTITFKDIILNSGEYILFYDPDHQIDANLYISNTIKQHQIFISNPS